MKSRVAAAAPDPALLRALQQAFPTCRRLDPRELRELLVVARPVLLPDGEVLFYEGDPAGPAWMILEGTVRVEVSAPGQRPLLLGRLGPGDFIGDMSLVDGRPRAATAQVEAPLWALVLDRGGWDQLRQEAHPAAMWLMSELDRHVSGRVRQMYDRVARLKSDPSLADEPPRVVERPTLGQRLRALWRPRT